MVPCDRAVLARHIDRHRGGSDMLGVLLESRARRQRRSGGVALSVITHLALIAAATAATARGPRTAREKPAPVFLRFTPPPPPETRSTPPDQPVRATVTTRAI